MTVRRLFFIPLVLAATLSPVTGSGHVHGVSSGQKERAAPQKRAAQVHYICPMHPDVKSKSRGICPKCKMSLVRKRIVKPSTTVTRDLFDVSSLPTS
jgi:hypothetical protein